MQNKVKKVVVISILFFSGALSASSTFTARAKYTKIWGDHRRPVFNELEKKGIMHQAILEAQKNCNLAGKRDCVYVNSRITKCGYATGVGAASIGCDGEATLIAVD